MSCVLILTPVVIASWPALSSAVVAAAASLGFEVLSDARKKGVANETSNQVTSVNLDIDRSEVVTGALGREQAITVTRDGVTVRFSRDARGKAALCVTGRGHREDELRALGEELSRSVVQHYVYQRLMSEMQARGFNVVEEEVTADRAIRLKVRLWED
jgi:hypothetical protein